MSSDGGQSQSFPPEIERDVPGDYQTRLRTVLWEWPAAATTAMTSWPWQQSCRLVRPPAVTTTIIITTTQHDHTFQWLLSLSSLTNHLGYPTSTWNISTLTPPATSLNQHQPHHFGKLQPRVDDYPASTPGSYKLLSLTMLSPQQISTNKNRPSTMTLISDLCSIEQAYQPLPSPWPTSTCLQGVPFTVYTSNLHSVKQA